MHVVEDQWFTIPALMDDLRLQERDILSRLSEVFAEAGEELVLVGGTVRDLMIGRTPVTDLDLATSALPEQTQIIGLRADPSSVYTVGEQFGTVGFSFDFTDNERTLVEITTYRAEEYPTSTRHPVVRHAVTLEEDLSRRDFTMNAIAMQPQTAALFDPFGGVADLAHRRIAAVGDAAKRFNEDPLRILRAARFAAQLGFDIAPETFEAMRLMGPQLARISVERISAELNRLLVGNEPGHGLQILQAADLLPAILPELVPMAEDDRDGGVARHKDIWEHTVRVVEQTPPRLTLRWAALLHDAAKPATRSIDEQGEVHFYAHEHVGAQLARTLLRRLKQDKTLTQHVSQLVAMHLRGAGYDSSWTDSAVRRLALEAGPVMHDLLDLAAADVTSARADRIAAAAARVEGLRHHLARLEEQASLDALQSPLDGDVLMEGFGLGPGLWIKIIKERLRNMVIDGELAIGDTTTAWDLAHGWMADPDEELTRALKQIRSRD